MIMELLVQQRYMMRNEERFVLSKKQDLTVLEVLIIQSARQCWISVMKWGLSLWMNCLICGRFIKTAMILPLHFLDEWEKVTTVMVNKDYNHPCVAIYSIGNEISELGTTRGVEISRMLCKKLHELDDTRFTTCGVNGLNAAGADYLKL